jgi:carboxypeptidase D
MIIISFFIWIFGFFPPVYAGGFFERQPAEIIFKDPSELSALLSINIIIESVEGKTAYVFLTSEEFDRVHGLGFSVQWTASASKLRKQTGNGFPTYEELTVQLQAYADARPDICIMESAGQSVQERELWWLKITDRVTEEENEPEVHFIAAMHGDEPLSAVLCLRLIDHLIESYGSDERITRLVDETEIWIMPAMNPDGMEAGSRFNAAGVDLNRDFPDPVHEPVASTLGRQPETSSIMEWAEQHTPVLAANFHSGALVVNYPWDSDWDEDNAVEYEVAPDDALFRFISGVYASNNSMILNGPFPEGISNGSAWYPVRGGMQDWAYHYRGCLEVTIEMSRAGYPDASTFDAYWEENRDAMLAYLDLARMGIHGVVTNEETGEPLKAEIRVVGIDRIVFTDPDIGDYHRLLLPGEYVIHFTAAGYQSAAYSVIVGADEPGVLDVALAPLESFSDEGNASGGGCFIDGLVGETSMARY